MTKDSAPARHDATLAPLIQGRMAAEHARDLSDGEIERTLRGCVSPTRLIATAKRLRDAGLLAEPRNDSDTCECGNRKPERTDYCRACVMADEREE